jgi:hypothetical protein
MEILDTLWVYIEPIWAWLKAGVLAFGPLSEDGGVSWLHLGIQMGLIALVMALLMPSYGAILVFTVASVIVHVIVDVALPIVRDGAAFAMPPVTDVTYWQYIAFAGGTYLVGLTVLYIIKANILPR